jgi:hypothetical protein
LFFAYVQEGKFTEALDDVDIWDREKDTDLIWVRAAQAYIYGRAGQPAKARRLLAELIRSSRRHPVGPMIFVAPYVGIGENDQSFAWPEKSVAAHSPGLITLKVDRSTTPSAATRASTTCFAESASHNSAVPEHSERIRRGETNPRKVHLEDE